jgi:hypothetical protein
MSTDESLQIGHAGDFTVVPGVIHGLREWEIYTEGSHLRLGAMAQSAIWPVDEVFHAHCLCQRAEEEAELHEAPGAGCSCGIHAHHPILPWAEMIRHELEAFVELDHRFDSGWPVHGVIAAWGRTEVHEDGFRAQHGLPVALFVPECSRDSKWEEAIRRVAGEYGVPAVDVADDADLEELCAHRWPGLTEELVSELLIGGREVVLEPVITSLILRDDQPVAGNGFGFQGRRYRPWIWDSQWLIDEPGVRVVRVAGTTHTQDAIQGDEFAPGRTVRLMPEDNEHDRWATALYDESGEVKAGYVPSDLSCEVRVDLEAGRLDRAFVAWQWRDLRTGKRIGICVLIPRRGVEITIVDEPRRVRRRKPTVLRATTDGRE